VIERLVDPGQTVAASFSAPELFKIAGDLSKIKIDAAIVEGDVSGLDNGDPVSFSVDAYPGRIFRGAVDQLRLKSETQSNIVTYTAVVDAANDDGALMPGMTTNLQITSNSKKDILRIPANAERFRLENDTEELREQIADPAQTWRRSRRQKELRDIFAEIIKSELTPPQYQSYRQIVQASSNVRDAQIWVKDGDKMVQRMVGLGLSDGSFIEVISGLSEGDSVVTSIGTAGGRRGPPRGRPG